MERHPHPRGRADRRRRQILAANETITPDPGQSAATVNNTSSIYAVKFGSSEGDQGVTGLTNGGVQVEDLGQLQDKPAYRTRIEFYVGLGVFSGKAAARLKGVLNG